MEPVPRLRALGLVFGGLATAAAACFLSARGVEPVATWLYPFAWYPLLLAVEGGVALRRGRFLLLGRPRLLLSVLAWSVPLWMLWEVLNFRLENWHYVFVPDRRAELWTGVILSFATVLPACFLPAALLWPGDRSSRARTGSATGRGSTGGLGSGTLAGIRLAGAGMLLLPLVWPRYFFPLVWGGFLLLVEPDLYRSAPSRSLLADVEAGRWSRIVALLVGGAVAGLTWESLNAVARGSWIYTVPGLEELKVFEMPPLGFLGFPPLALSCFTLYQWLVIRGWAVPLRLSPDAPPGSRPPAARSSVSARLVRLAAAALVVLTLLGIEEWTISSRTPRLRDLPPLLPSDVETLVAWGIDSPFLLARTEPDSLAARVPGLEVSRAAEWIGASRLATTRGMGTRHARRLHGWGIGSPEALARTDPDSLAACFRALPDSRVRAAQVRIWWRAARDRTGTAEVGEELPGC